MSQDYSSRRDVERIKARARATATERETAVAWHVVYRVRIISGRLADSPPYQLTERVEASTAGRARKVCREKIKAERPDLEIVQHMTTRKVRMLKFRPPQPTGPKAA